MQQVAYTGYQGPQQIPQMTMEPTAFFADSVIPMLPGWEHSKWLVIRDDFRVITDNTGEVEVLRFFERLVNRRVAKLRKEHNIPEDYLPHDDDLRIAATKSEIEEGILGFWSESTCYRALYSLIDRSFLGQFFIARKTAAVMKQPATTIYEDDKGFYISVNRAGYYTDINGEEHNAKDEGYDIEWQYLLCFDAIRAAIAKAAWREPPEPAKRWPPIVKRRDPVQPPQQGEGEEAHIRQDSASCPETSKLTSPNGAKVGTNGPPLGDALPTVQDTTTPKDESTIRAEFRTNIPVSSAISHLSQDTKQAEDFCKAPWCPETIIGLAKSRHTLGLFEITGDDADYEGAESLDRLMLRLGMEPKGFWPLVDQHIAAMMDPASETWYATGRMGGNLVFGLAHVAKNWNAVEEKLVKKPWWPLNPVPYFGPPHDTSQIVDTRDHSWIFGNARPPSQDLPPTIDPEPPLIIEGSLGSPEETIEEMHDAQGDAMPSGETEQQEMHQLPPPTTATLPPRNRGMTMGEYNALFVLVNKTYPMISMGVRRLDDGSFVLAIEWAENQWIPVRSMTEWHADPLIASAVKKAVKYGEGKGSSGAC